METKVIFALCFVAVANAAVTPYNSCSVPVCRNTTELFPHNDVTKFYQCRPILGCEDWEAIERPCAKGTWFSYKEQTCVLCGDKKLFENPCNVNPLPECVCIEGDPPGPIFIPESPPFNCLPPTCVKGNDKIPVELLHPSTNSYKYYQCRPVPGCDEWEPVEKDCGPLLKFGYKQQVCVWDCDWYDWCPAPTTTTPATTTTTTTRPTTTTTTTRPTTTTTTTRPTTTTTTTPRTTTPDAPTTIEQGECPLQPNCDGNHELLYPDPNDPTYYYQCVPQACGTWKPERRPCYPINGFKLYFNWKLQVCDWCDPNPCLPFYGNGVSIPKC